MAEIPVPLPAPPPPALPALNPQELEASVRTAGQRRVNIIWELTQAFIALAVSSATLFVAGSLALNGTGEMAAFLLLSNAFFLVVGFYFGRTNHQRMGGVGSSEIGR